MQRTHVSIPEELVAEIDLLVGKRKRSEFFVEAAERELTRHRQRAAIAAAAGSWQAKDYPALAEAKGVEKFVRELRKEGDVRLKKQG